MGVVFFLVFSVPLVAFFLSDLYFGFDYYVKQDYRPIISDIVASSILLLFILFAIERAITGKPVTKHWMVFRKNVYLPRERILVIFGWLSLFLFFVYLFPSWRLFKDLSATIFETQNYQNDMIRKISFNPHYVLPSISFIVSILGHIVPEIIRGRALRRMTEIGTVFPYSPLDTLANMIVISISVLLAIAFLTLLGLPGGAIMAVVTCVAFVTFFLVAKE